MMSCAGFIGVVVIFTAEAFAAVSDEATVTEVTRDDRHVVLSDGRNNTKAIRKASSSS